MSMINESPLHGLDAPWCLWEMRPDRIGPYMARRSPLQKESGAETPAPLAAVLHHDAPESRKLDVQRASGTVAVLPIQGVIEHHRSWWGDVFADEIGAALEAILQNKQIAATILDMDTPGGTVYGTPELAEQIWNHQKIKPIYALANAEMASAGYHIGSAATKVFVTPSGQVGSIGVWAAHVDQSKMIEDFGLDVTLISAGKFKVEGNPFEPLSDEGKEAIQAEIDQYYAKFVADVAHFRGRRESTVRNGFGEGRMVMAQAALEEGMVDGIATLPELLGAIVPRRRGKTALADLAIEDVG